MDLASDASHTAGMPAIQTEVVGVDPSSLGTFIESARSDEGLPLEDWNLELDLNTPDAQTLAEAARLLRESAIPVAFPTETVYGLGADATRSSSVLGIFKTKQRPSDNPLIVHIASIQQLRCLLLGSRSATAPSLYEPITDPIPDIYKPLIQRFWPGPLTILLPVPEFSPLAEETTAGLQTFGARMPRNILALALIKLADRPIAAPSANASGKPSPTAAEHVLHDLNGRIELIIDGGPCDVGVESTVVDGLVKPPVVLRPGGVSLAELRSVPGWADVKIGYDDQAAKDGSPRAPGMKYRHYSPKAKVFLLEKRRRLTVKAMEAATGPKRRIGIIRTKQWKRPAEEDWAAEDDHVPEESAPEEEGPSAAQKSDPHTFTPTLAQMLAEQAKYQATHIDECQIQEHGDPITVLDVKIGPDTKDIARGLFSALRALDAKEVDAIFVEGIDDEHGDDLAAAVMNRLRKAAETQVL
ncbi:Sua5/YciO/YrdC/YwlC family tRNA threonylcarbamoyl adenosine modification protein [Sphaceloma murrayae]|uniref:Threonylcarbamoyl-AMP synthase n=1 Tax=Sphaceloma murrayae TaxID=2082308 RepID=A0A2K1QZW3_9PEZI|nr:Sua5/YciO/YrdC/YwlC family tRNA threonylcarbamoyl adenosine modification protein [Sphaceloma murrayae]